MRPTTIDLNCVTRSTDQPEWSAMCEWNNGRVQLVTYFARNITCMLLDGEVKCRYTDITADEFKNLQRQCQEVADSLN